MTPPAKQREFDIDFFRGWVCLSLLVLHFYNSYLYDSYYRLFGETGKYYLWNWRLGVESFFVLAGFMMAHMLRPVPGEDVKIGGYLKRRFFRLIIPLWIAILLFAALKWTVKLVLKPTEDVPGLTDIFAQMFLLQEFFIQHDRLHSVVPVGYWSMVTLEQFYLAWLALYAICLAFVGRNQGKGYGPTERVMAFVTFLIALGSLSLWLLKIEVKGGIDNQNVIHLPTYAVFLSVGMMLYWAIRRRVFQGYFWITVVLIGASAIYTNLSPEYQAVSSLAKVMVAIAIFIPLARGIRVPDWKLFRFLTYCGQRSYSIYLIHGIAGIAFITLTWRLTNKSDWFAIPITLGAIAVSLVAAFIYFRFVEQPCQTRSRQVEYRQKHTEKVASAEPTPALEAVPVSAR